MRQIALPGHSFALPALGLGTWRMGEAAATRRAEVAAVRTALELGYRLLDTAEMYGEGGAEEVVGEALAQALRAGDVRREEVVVVSKVLPQNASRAGTQAACDRSRRRLGLDRIDLYLLHWRGPHPLHDTLDGLRALADAGAIGRWGVSNFDVDDLEELAAVAGPDECATNQVWYSLRERGPEFALLPWMRERAMPLMAYSPIDMGDAGISVFSGLKSVFGLLSGGGSAALETDTQQGVDAALKLLALAYFIHSVYPGDMLDKIRMFYGTPSGKALLTYYAAVEVGLPFADNALVGGGNFVSSLYEKHGFHIIGLRKSYYQPSGADAFTMRRPAMTGFPHPGVERAHDSEVLS